MVVHPQSESCFWSFKAVRHLFSSSIFSKAWGGCLGRACVVLLANEANDHYENFIAPLFKIFLDQIGIEKIGFGEKEKTGENQKINGGGRVCHEIGTELSSQLLPNMAINSKGKHSRVSHANACVLDACTPKWCVRLACAFVAYL